jgi:hypothetical protein
MKYSCAARRFFIAAVMATAFTVVDSTMAASSQSQSGSPEHLPFLLRTNYHGWTNSIWISNGKVETIIVPAIGRVMQFRFVGAADGPFWENELMFGKAPDPASQDWSNFGGDKTWPAPQTDWPKVTPRAWPPPVAFDSLPVEAQVDGWEVTLVSPVDPHYGIRARRDIKLIADQPVMTITTTFEKVSGLPRHVSVWVITQLKHPLFACATLPDQPRFMGGYVLQSDQRPPDLKVMDNLLSLTRDPKASHKVGTDAGTLIWVGTRDVLRIDSPRVWAVEYPDEGSSAEIYTNADPLSYVELEMLGPLQPMRKGDQITRRCTYTLHRRTEPEPEMEVRKLLAR